MNELHTNDKVWIVLIEDEQIILSTNEEMELKPASWTNSALEIEQAVNLAVIQNPKTKGVIVVEDFVTEIKEDGFNTVMGYECKF